MNLREKTHLSLQRKKYFNGHSDIRSVQENFDLLTSFIHDSADNHIPSKTSRSVSSISWITPEIRRKIRRNNKTHAKAKKTGSSKFRLKFEILRREIKADVRKQHDLYVNNLVGDVKANPRDFYRYIRKKTPKVFYPGKGRMERVLLSRTSKRRRNSMVSLWMCSIKMNTPRSRFWIGLHLSWMIFAVSKDEVIKLLKGLNPSKTLGPDELHPRVLKELAKELGPVFAHLFQQLIDTGEIPKEWSLANICPLFKKGGLRAIIARFPRLVHLESYSNTQYVQISCSSWWI